MTDVDTGKAAIGNTLGALKTEARAANRRGDNVAYLMLLDAHNKMFSLSSRCDELERLAIEWMPFDPENIEAQNEDEILAYRPDAGTFIASYVEPDDGESDMFWVAYPSFEDLTGDYPTMWAKVPVPPAYQRKGE